MRPVVDRLFDEHQRLMELLDASNELSLRIATDATLRKALLLSAASYFERCITRAIMEHVNTAAKRSACVVSLVESKAVKRQYHTYFDWNKTNANKFFAIFGTEFKGKVQERVQEDSGLAEGVKAFMKIGQKRNKMVHDDFGSYSLDMTAVEIMELYRTALGFVEAVPLLLEDCIGTSRS